MLCQPEALIWALGSREWGSSTPWPKVRELRKINSGERGRGEGSGRILFLVIEMIPNAISFQQLCRIKGKRENRKETNLECKLDLCCYSGILDCASNFHFLLYPEGSTDPNSTRRCSMLCPTRRETQGPSANSHSELEVQPGGRQGLAWYVGGPRFQPQLC